MSKLSDPTNTKGVYPSDVAYTRTQDGLVPRGKTAYGDGVLEHLGPNKFKVLATAEIVRRKVAEPAPTEEKNTPVEPPPTAPKATNEWVDEKPASKKAAKRKLKKSA